MPSLALMTTMLTVDETTRVAVGDDDGGEDQRHALRDEDPGSSRLDQERGGDGAVADLLGEREDTEEHHRHLGHAEG